MWQNLVGEEDYEFANMFIRLSELYPEFDADENIDVMSGDIENRHRVERDVVLDEIGFTYDSSGGYYQNEPSWEHDYSQDDSDGDWE